MSLVKVFSMSVQKCQETMSRGLTEQLPPCCSPKSTPRQRCPAWEMSMHNKKGKWRSQNCKELLKLKHEAAAAACYTCHGWGNAAILCHHNAATIVRYHENKMHDTLVLGSRERVGNGVARRPKQPSVPQPECLHNAMLVAQCHHIHACRPHTHCSLIITTHWESMHTTICSVLRNSQCKFSLCSLGKHWRQIVGENWGGGWEQQHHALSRPPTTTTHHHNVPSQMKHV